MVQGSDLTMRSGGPNSLVAFHSSVFGHSRGRGISLISPSGAPESTHRTMVSIWSCVRDMSFLNFCTPTVGSICHGGIWRVMTRSRMALAHGRVSSYLTSDMGAIEPV